MVLNIDFDLQPDTERKIKQVLDQYPDKEMFFKDIIAHRVSELKNGIHNIEIDLKEFEEKFQLSSEDFYNQFRKGKLDDQEEYMIWSGIYEMRLRSKKELLELE